MAIWNNTLCRFNKQKKLCSTSIVNSRGDIESRPLDIQISSIHCTFGKEFNNVNCILCCSKVTNPVIQESGQIAYNFSPISFLSLTGKANEQRIVHLSHKLTLTIANGQEIGVVPNFGLICT